MRSGAQARHRIRLGGETRPCRNRVRALAAGGGDAGPVMEQAGLGFGGLLRELRDDAGLPQDVLAEAAQVSQRAVSDLERASIAPPARTPRCCWPGRWASTVRRVIRSYRRARADTGRRRGYRRALKATRGVRGGRRTICLRSWRRSSAGRRSCPRSGPWWNPAAWSPWPGPAGDRGRGPRRERPAGYGWRRGRLSAPKQPRAVPVLSPDGLHGTRLGFAALRGATPLTCADSARRGQLGVAFAAAKGLLMRFGFAPIRGSNPRASAAHRSSPRQRGRGSCGLPGRKVAVWVAVRPALAPNRSVILACR